MKVMVRFSCGVLALVAGLSLTHCSTMEEAGTEPPDGVVPIPKPIPPSGKGYVVKRVFYGTNRRRTFEPDENANSFYGSQRGGLQMGFCYASIPGTHTTGEVEAPLLNIEFLEDPKQHVVLMEVHQTSRRGFARELQQDAGAKKRAFVFIHGYNVAFKDAARRTAQLAHDLEFDGAAVFFSWPSRGDVTKYSEDLTDNQWSKQDLRTFLQRLAAPGGVEEITILAHSMGNLLTTQVLAEIHEKLGSKLKAIVLAAPDIDAETFKRDIAPEFAEMEAPVTVYASRRDKALMVSEGVWGYERAGQNAALLAGLPGIEAIDSGAAATNYLHHAYFGDSTRLLRDLRLVIAGVPPADGRRGYLRERANGKGQRYWSLGQ